MFTGASEIIRLLADIGGTNARFALLQGNHAKPQQALTLATIDFPRLIDAIRHYLHQCGSPEVLEGAIAIASPILGDRVKMTNHHWDFSIEETRKELGFRRLEVLNDFTALALALPVLPQDELRQSGGDKAIPNTALALIGAGTGLGVSGLIPNGNGGWTAVSGEGGHVTLCAVDDREADIINVCRAAHKHISAERLVSGMGLVNLYNAIAQLEGAASQPLTPALITERGLTGSDPLCTEALETFCGMLGNVAGNLVLTLGARGGLYIGGGIVPKLGDYFHRSRFRQRFEAKGRYVEYLAPIPAYVIHTKDPALLGAATILGVDPS